jgi:hypothetical protein
MKKDFVIRGQLASGKTETIEFGGYKEGYAYKVIGFELFPSAAIGTQNCELSATLTAAKTFEDPSNPSFNNEGLIASSLFRNGEAVNYAGPLAATVINHTFLITQNLILAVIDNYPGAPMAVNYQLTFESVKMTDSQAAATNFKQFSIFDE